MQNNANRRSVLKLIVGTGLSILGLGGAKAAWAADELVKESDPISVGFKYCDDAKSPSCAVKDKGPDGICGKCVHYNKDGKSEKKISGKTAAPCALMQNKFVNTKGTCMMFAKK